MEQTATLEVKIEQNPLEKLSLDVVKGTKKQQKKEAKAISFYIKEGLRMHEEEFNILIKNNANSKWLETKIIHDSLVFGNYFEVPDDYKETVCILVVTFPHTEPGYIRTSFYVFSKGHIFRGESLDDVQDIIDNLKKVWLHIFREYVADLIEELQEEKAKPLI